MKKEILCKHCQKPFAPSPQQAKFIEEAKKKGMTFIMLDCPLCKRCTSYDPTSKEQPAPAAEVDLSRTYRCPVAHCHGWVSYIESGEIDPQPFWGCGECGSIWYKAENLFKEISEIVRKYPYRERCYVKVGQEWRATDLEEQPENYEELVEGEPFDAADGFVRG